MGSQESHVEVAVHLLEDIERHDNHVRSISISSPIPQDAFKAFVEDFVFCASNLLDYYFANYGIHPLDSAEREAVFCHLFAVIPSLRQPWGDYRELCNIQLEQAALSGANITRDPKVIFGKLKVSLNSFRNFITQLP